MASGTPYKQGISEEALGAPLSIRISGEAPGDALSARVPGRHFGNYAIHGFRRLTFCLSLTAKRSKQIVKQAGEFAGH